MDSIELDPLTTVMNSGRRHAGRRWQRSRGFYVPVHRPDGSWWWTRHGSVPARDNQARHARHRPVLSADGRLCERPRRAGGPGWRSSRRWPGVSLGLQPAALPLRPARGLRWMVGSLGRWPISTSAA